MTGSVALAVVCFWACSSNETKPTGSADTKTHAVNETLKHEKCPESGAKVETLDANNDGKPDITKAMDARGRELCRATDLNHDGINEMYEYFDESGQLRRRELNFEASDAISAIEYYEGGKLIKRELDTTGQRRVDTWDYYDPATGKRTKRERDTNNDGKVDQWWAFNADGTITVATDKNGDGEPDPDATITINPNGSIFVPDAGTQTASSSDGGSNVPPPPPPPVLMADDDAGTLMVDAGSTKKKPPAKTGGK